MFSVYFKMQKERLAIALTIAYLILWLISIFYLDSWLPPVIYYIFVWIHINILLSKYEKLKQATTL